MNLQKDATQNITDRLVWFTALKDQSGITKDLSDGKEIEEIYGLGEGALFDEFFYFLSHFGIADLALKLKPKIKKRETETNFIAVFFIYIMRIVAGCRYFWNIKPVLLQSQPLMHLVGFNAHQIREGSNQRGLHKSRKDEEENNQEEKERQENKENGSIRGPVCAQFIAGFISAILASALEIFFNKVISILAANSFFPKRVHALLDASDIESTEACKGRGKVTKEKALELKQRQKRIRKVTETVFGFKIWVVWDPTSKLPIAMRFTTIEVGDINMAQEVVQQAIDNLGTHAKIVSLAFDRGFIDGKFMWWLHRDMGITFYVPAKTNMNVYTDALSCVDSGIRKQRERQRKIGAGKNSSIVTDHWDVVAIEGLTSAGFYSEQGSGSHENSKHFRPNPINAVVVINDPYKENNPDSQHMVILTNGPVNDPFVPFEGYDDRSEIENGLFREAKQAWFIERPSENTKASYRAHVYLTILTMALTTVFRAWMDKQDKLESKGTETGVRKFRETVRQENGNKLIVFDGPRYAIFEAYEVVILCGRKVRMPRGVPETIEKKDILIKYGVLLE